MNLRRWLRWRTDRELDDEFQAHLDSETERNIERGLTPEEARLAARRRFGNVTLLREKIRDADPFAWIAPVRRDVRYAFRNLARNPGFTVTAMLSIALGIGASTAVFSLADGTLLRPLDVPHPGEIVRVFATMPQDRFGGFSHREYTAYRDRNQTLTGLLAQQNQSFALQTKENDVASYVFGQLVSGNFLAVLGVEPMLGRSFTAEEDSPGAREIVALLSYPTWQSKFDSDPNVAGAHVKLNGQAATILGVMPSRFTGTDLFNRPEIYIPLGATPRVFPGNALLSDPKRRGLALFGRLRPGVPLRQAQAEFAAIAPTLDKVYPSADRQRSAAVLNEVESRFEIDSDGYQFLILLAGIAAMVLLVACTNVANLLLGRASARVKEVSIRRSIGASRARLIGQLMVENAVLAALGSATGLLFAWWAIQSFAAIKFPSDFPVEIATRLDARVMAFTLVAMAGSVLLFGLWPTLRGTNVDLVSVTKGARDLSSTGRLGARLVLVAGQTALSLVVLVSASLFMVSFLHASGRNPGFRTDHVLLVSFDPALVGYSEPRTRSFYRDLQERIRALPGVRSVALASHVQLGPEQSRRGFTRQGTDVPGGDNSLNVVINKVEPGFFDTMATPIVRGRAIDVRDAANAPPAAVVNQSLAKRFWPQQDAVGQRVQMGKTILEVVGIARDGKYVEALEKDEPYVYLAYQQDFQSRMTLFVHTAADPVALVPDVRQAVKTLAPGLPSSAFRTMRDVVENKGLLLPRILAEVTAAAGLIGLCLGAVGTYAVVAFVVSRRTREIGIRMAVGATAKSVLGNVLRSGMRMTLAGIGLGLAGALALTGVFSQFLDHVDPRDPTIFASVSVLVAVVAAAACWVPARRASRVDPAVTLRSE